MLLRYGYNGGWDWLATSKLLHRFFNLHRQAVHRIEGTPRGLTTPRFHDYFQHNIFLLVEIRISYITVEICLTLLSSSLNVLYSLFLRYHSKTDYWLFWGLCWTANPAPNSDSANAIHTCFYYSADTRLTLHSNIICTVPLLLAPNLFLSTLVSKKAHS